MWWENCVGSGAFRCDCGGKGENKSFGFGVLFDGGDHFDMELNVGISYGDDWCKDGDDDDCWLRLWIFKQLFFNDSKNNLN